MELAEVIEKEYQLPVKEMTIHNGILLTRNYIVSSRGSKYFIKQWNDNYKTENIDTQQRIHNNSEACLFPKMLFTSDRKSYFMANGKKYSIYHYIDHDKSYDMVDYLEYGKALALTHKELKSMGTIELTPGDIEYDKLANVLKSTTLNDVVSNKLIENISAIDYSLLEDSRFYQCLHGDFNRDNILVKCGKIVGVIDFTDFYYGSIFSDIADGALFLCFDKNDAFMRDNFNRFLQGYASQNSLLNILDEKKIVHIIVYQICMQLIKFYPILKISLRREKVREYMNKLILRLNSIINFIL